MSQLKGLADWLRDNVPLIGGWLAYVVERLEEAWEWLINTAYEVAGKAWNWITSTGQWIWDWITTTGQWIYDQVVSLGQWIWDNIQPALDWITEQLNNIGTIIWNVISPVIEGINGAIDWLKEQIGGAWNWITTTGQWLVQQADSIARGIETVANSVANLSQDVYERLGNLASDLHGWWLWAYQQPQEFIDWIASSMRQALRDFIVWLATEVVKALLNDLIDVQYDVETGQLLGQPSSPLTQLLAMEVEV